MAKVPRRGASEFATAKSNLLVAHCEQRGYMQPEGC